jgi:hypothetical protein
MAVKTVFRCQFLRFYDILVKAGVPSELHIFANGPHGTGLGKCNPVLDRWPNLLESWVRAHDHLKTTCDRQTRHRRQVVALKSANLPQN